MRPITIDELGKEEDKLIFQVECTQGTIEVMLEQLSTAGVFVAYKQVHSLYADLAKNDNEALKRGLFLQWYGLVTAPFVRY